MAQEPSLGGYSMETRSTKPDLVDLQLLLLEETDEAILVFDGTRKVWLPRSLIEVEDAFNHAEVIVTLPEWLALKGGLI